MNGHLLAFPRLDYLLMCSEGCKSLVVFCVDRGGCLDCFSLRLTISDQQSKDGFLHIRLLYFCLFIILA